MFFIGALQMCSKDDIKPLGTEEGVYGNWNWISSSGGFAGIEKSPESEGYEQGLTISESGVFSIFRADTLAFQHNFSIVEEESIIHNKSRLMLTFEGDDMIDQSFVIKGNDTLILVEECWDCFIHKYVREK